MEVQITHVRFSKNIRDHEHITHVQYVAPGQVDSAEKAVMVLLIDDHGWAAFVGAGSSRVRVYTVHPQGSAAYLRTIADGKWANNLLNLPTF